MAALSSRLRSSADGGIMFFCPGCKEPHQVRIGAGPGPRWGYNGDPENPTFTPSILVRGVRLDMSDDDLEAVLDEYNLPEDRKRVLADKRINTVCHTFVTAGRVQFLSDCTHSLAGTTVDMPAFSLQGEDDA